jgi:hypothetical protein
MKRLLISCLIVSSNVLSPALKADQIIPDQAEQVPTETESNMQIMTATTPDTTLDETSKETPVGQAANEGMSAAKRKQWQNIALAAGAVAVAVTALILVASNDGHHHKSDSKH